MSIQTFRRSTWRGLYPLRESLVEAFHLCAPREVALPEPVHEHRDGKPSGLIFDGRTNDPLEIIGLKIKCRHAHRGDERDDDHDEDHTSVPDRRDRPIG